jgi:hypothetical protein
MNFAAKGLYVGDNTQREKDAYERMNEGHAHYHSIGADTEAAPWFLTEAAAFLGAPRPRRELSDSRLLLRVAERMRRRVRPESLISGSLFGLARHGAIAALYLGLVYAAKFLFGISITLNAVR